jgi:putative NADH-flavin reductase
MLSRFRKHLASRKNLRVEVKQADVMDLQTLPSAWRDYDLVISTSMLEYLPRQDLPSAQKESRVEPGFLDATMLA